MTKIDKRYIKNDLLLALEAFDVFITTERQLSRHSVDSYWFDIDNFLCFLLLYKNELLNSASVELNLKNIKSGEGEFAPISIKDLEDSKLDLFRRWIYYRADNSISSRSSVRAISALKGLFDFLNENSFLKNEEIRLLSKPKVSKLLPKVINKEMFDSLCSGFDSVCKKPWQAMRDKAIAMLIFTSGLRISEVLSLKVSDFSGGRDFLHITGKGSKQRIVPLLKQPKNLVVSYIAICPVELNSNDLVFVSNCSKKYTSRLVQRVFESARRVAGLPEYITPHKLRHSCATLLLENSDDENALKKIKDLLGHSNLATTEIYTKVSTKMITDALSKIDYWKS